MFRKIMCNDDSRSAFTARIAVGTIEINQTEKLPKERIIRLEGKWFISEGQLGSDYQFHL